MPAFRKHTPNEICPKKTNRTTFSTVCPAGRCRAMNSRSSRTAICHSMRQLRGSLQGEENAPYGDLTTLHAQKERHRQEHQPGQPRQRQPSRPPHHSVLPADANIVAMMMPACSCHRGEWVPSEMARMMSRAMTVVLTLEGSGDAVARRRAASKALVSSWQA
jgi:hypothetical protein